MCSTQNARALNTFQTEMPIQIEDLDNRIGNLIRLTGSVDEDEYFAAIRPHLEQEPNKFAKYRFSISDYSQVTELTIPSSAVKRLADLCKVSAQTNPEVLIATVAQGDLAFGVSRMWEMLIDEVEGWEPRVFRSMPDAQDWINLRVHARFGLTGLTFEPVSNTAQGS